MCVSPTRRFSGARDCENEDGDPRSESPSREAADDGELAAMVRLDAYHPHRP
jgi:hypothetical protein